MVDPRVLLGLDPGPGSMVKTRVWVFKTRVLESLIVTAVSCQNIGRALYP